MRKRTMTRNLNDAITNGLLQIDKVQCRSKSSSQVDALNDGTFIENLQFLCESGVFADFVDWHYKRWLSEKGELFIVDSGAMNPYSEHVVTVYLSVCDGVNVENVERILKIEEE